MEKSYHHGNLKEELIKKGIEFINEVGEEKLSLRKLAIICGVSNSAPYTHFKSKDELLKGMSLYILNLLKLELENTRKKYKNKENLLVILGKTYVIFFLKNPKYYYFLSSRKDIEINLSLKFDNDNITALDILKEEAVNKFSKLGVSNEDIQNKILAMWSLVAGLVAIINMTSKNYLENWEDKIEEIIKASFISYGK